MHGSIPNLKEEDTKEEFRCSTLSKNLIEII